MPEQSTPTLWSLLIGIDCYMGQTMAGLPNYRSLRGCVNDIALMDEFLRTRLLVPAERIVKLTASGMGVVPDEPRASWPTKANIVAAFRSLAQRAQPGDQVYIHYSGHGGRAVTLFPQVKGVGGLDESLVPTDYGQIENVQQPEDRYLRDLELAWLLQELVDSRLNVTIVMDSCHSGGAARGEEEGAVARGGLDPDMVQRTPSDLVAAPEALLASWPGQAGSTRAATLASGWLPDPQGYTLLAACRASELAKEMRPAPSGKNHGALTYWLVQTLQVPGLNWEAVHQQVVARVHGKFPSQTPQLQGVGNRAVFGGAALSLPIGVNVLEVQGDRLRLNIGASGGVNKGAQFFVYRQGVTNFKQTDQRTAVAKVDAPVTAEDGSINDAECWATIRRLTSDETTPGCQAVLFDPGSSQQRLVRLARGGPVAVEIQDKALADLTAAIQGQESLFTRLAAASEAATFQVGLNAAGTYELRDSGGRPLPNVSAVPIDDPKEVVYRLEHLARYFNVLELASPDALSRLAGKLEVKLLHTPDEPFDELGGTATVMENEPYYLLIRNLFEPEGYTMNITVLNLAPDWSIQRLIPPDDQKQFELGPGETLLIDQGRGQRALPALRSAVPDGASEALDILKVFATTDTTSYDSLQLLALDDIARKAALVSPETQEPERTWITAQVMVRAVKP